MRTVHGLVAVVICAFGMQGCLSVGDTAIRFNRTSYNEAIHETSNQQLLLNIVRAHVNEAPTFLNIAGIDGSNSGSATIAGGASMLGLAAGTLGSLAGTATLSDAPITRYSSLGGSELISQVSLPVSLQSISRLETSDWPSTPLLVLTVQRMTPAFTDFFRAVETLSALEAYGAISYDSRAMDDLEIQLHPRGNVFKVQSADPSDRSLTCLESKATTEADADRTVARLWQSLESIYGVSNNTNTIVLGSIMSKFRHIPTYTGSALNVLKQAAQRDGPFAFLTEQQQAIVQAANENAKNCFNEQFYYLPDHIDDPATATEEVRSLWEQEFIDVRQHNDAAHRAQFRDRGYRKVFVLIVRSNASRPAGFVNVQRNGVWFSVNDDDKVSKRNMLLLNQILTIQAAPATGASPPATIALNRP